MKTPQTIALLASSLPAAMAASPPRTVRGRGRGRHHGARIIGGDEAAPGRYPYAVALSDRIGHFCGGSLLGRDVVLSAAHCQGGRYGAVVGRHDLGGDPSGGEEIPKKTEVPHPDYNAQSMDNDFLLVFLERPVSQEVEYVKLNSDPSHPPIDAPVTVMGWGDTDDSDDVSAPSNVLLEVEVNVISNRECERSEGNIGNWEGNYFDQITDNMLCTKDAGEDACQGDSGGPLVIKRSGGSSADVQVGVVSWGIACAHADFPGVYARVSSVYDWVREEVCVRSSFPPSDFDCDGLNAEPGPTKVPAVLTQWPTWSPTSSLNQKNISETAALPTYWPTYSPSLSPTLSPTLSPSLSPTLSPNVLEIVSGTDEGGWYDLLSEDFSSGYGSFLSVGGTKLHDVAMGRIGVANIQGSSYIYSNEIALNNNHYRLKVTLSFALVESTPKLVRVVFSFYVVRMNPEDGFCLDHAFGRMRGWREAKCWKGCDDYFAMKRWMDDTIVEFEVPDAAESLKIRFRCDGDSKHDDVLIDKVEVRALALAAGGVAGNGAELPTVSLTVSEGYNVDPNLPSYFPTMSPTVSVDEDDRIEPSFLPTHFPTLSPTSLEDSDSAEPTFFPTYFPTVRPTSSEGDEDGSEPTFSPTGLPTYFPTASPTFTRGNVRTRPHREPVILQLSDGD